MSDLKSKLPDLKELGSMTSKFFKDIKNSVSEIIHDYKKKRKDTSGKTPHANPVKGNPGPHNTTKPQTDKKSEPSVKQETSSKKETTAKENGKSKKPNESTPKSE